MKERTGRPGTEWINWTNGSVRGRLSHDCSQRYCVQIAPLKCLANILASITRGTWAEGVAEQNGELKETLCQSWRTASVDPTEKSSAWRTFAPDAGEREGQAIISPPRVRGNYDPGKESITFFTSNLPIWSPGAMNDEAAKALAAAPTGPTLEKPLRRVRYRGRNPRHFRENADRRPRARLQLQGSRPARHADEPNTRPTRVGSVIGTGRIGTG